MQTIENQIQKLKNNNDKLLEALDVIYVEDTSVQDELSSELHKNTILTKLLINKNNQLKKSNQKVFSSFNLN